VRNLNDLPVELARLPAGCAAHLQAPQLPAARKCPAFVDAAQSSHRPPAEATPSTGATIPDVAASPTTRVEIDTDLLDRLRKRRPERSDRELLESAVRIQLGREAIARVRKRFAGVSMEEIEREAVKAVHEARRERAAG
jgi:hypothetical protein